MALKRENYDREWLAPAIVAALTFLTFLPVLWNEFVAWDDDRDLLDNLHRRGLGWTQLKWMFTPLWLHTQIFAGEMVEKWQLSTKLWCIWRRRNEFENGGAVTPKPFLGACSFC